MYGIRPHGHYCRQWNGSQADKLQVQMTQSLHIKRPHLPRALLQEEVELLLLPPEEVEPRQVVVRVAGLAHQKRAADFLPHMLHWYH